MAPTIQASTIATTTSTNSTSTITSTTTTTINTTNTITYYPLWYKKKVLAAYSEVICAGSPYKFVGHSTERVLLRNLSTTITTATTIKENVCSFQGFFYISFFLSFFASSYSYTLLYKGVPRNIKGRQTTIL